jgi:hypothetical protein
MVTADSWAGIGNAEYCRRPDRARNQGRYYPYTVRYLEGKLFVTVLGEDKVFVFDRDLKQTNTIAVGKTPQESCTDGRQLYVVNTGATVLSVIDTQNRSRDFDSFSRAARQSVWRIANLVHRSIAINCSSRWVIRIRWRSLIVSPIGQVGSIPTGWYPTKVLTNSDHLLYSQRQGNSRAPPQPQGTAGRGPQPHRRLRATLC